MFRYLVLNTNHIVMGRHDCIIEATTIVQSCIMYSLILLLYIVWRTGATLMIT